MSITRSPFTVTPEIFFFPKSIYYYLAGFVAVRIYHGGLRSCLFTQRCANRATQ